MKKVLAISLIFLIAGSSLMFRSASTPYVYADVTYGSEVNGFTGDFFNVELARFSDTQFVLCTSDTTDAAREGLCVIGNVTGDTIEFGEPAQFTADVFGPYMDVCVLDSDTFAVVYTADGLDDDGYVSAADVSSTSTIGAYSLEEFADTDVEYASCTTIDTDKVFVSYDDETNSDTGTSIAMTFSGTDATFGTPDDWEATDHFPIFTRVEKLATDTAITCFYDTDVGGAGCLVSTVSGTTITHGSVVNFTPAGFFMDQISIGVPEDNKATLFWGDSPDNTVYTMSALALTTSGTTITYGASSTATTTDMYNSGVVPVSATESLLVGRDFDTGLTSSNFATVDYSARTVTPADTWLVIDNTSVNTGDADSLDTVKLTATDFVVCLQSLDTAIPCRLGSVESEGGGEVPVTMRQNLIIFE